MLKIISVLYFIFVCFTLHAQVFNRKVLYINDKLIDNIDIDAYIRITDTTFFIYEDGPELVEDLHKVVCDTAHDDLVSGIAYDAGFVFYYYINGDAILVTSRYENNDRVEVIYYKE